MSVCLSIHRTLLSYSKLDTAKLLHIIGLNEYKDRIDPKVNTISSKDFGN